MPSNLTVTPDLEDLFGDNIQELINLKPWMKTRSFKLVESMEELRDFIDQAIAAGKCTIDFETTGLSTRTKKILDPATGNTIKIPVEKVVGVGLCYESKSACYTAINHKIGEKYNLNEKLVFDELRRLCTSCNVIFHNAKFDMAHLNMRGIYIDGAKKFDDTQIMARLYNSNQKDLKLKNLSERILNQPMLKFDDMVRNKGGRFDLVDPIHGYYYGASDAICTFDLYNYFEASPIVQQQGQIYGIEKRVVFSVMEMESNLVRIDLDYLRSEKQRVENRLKEITREIYEIAGHEFNIGSPVQLGKILTEEFKFNLPRTEKGSIATDNAALKGLAVTQPICKKIIAFRALEKSVGTYIENLLNNVDEDGFIKLGFHQSGTDTGRFSSPGGKGLTEDGYCGVNVQSVPKATKDEDSGENLPDIRRAVIAREGKTIVAADYENEEMRVAANLSNETAWIDAVSKGIDFHTATGAIIAGGKPASAVTPEERRLGKTTNFLSLYLGGARTLAANAGISEAEAKRVLNAFFAGVPHLKSWIDREIKKARKLKYVKTLFGRVRPLAEFYDSEDRGLQNHGDRCVINTQVQGVCADIMKSVMAKLYSWIHANGLEQDIKVLITMHDELVFEITTEKLELLVPEIAKIMMLPEIIRDIFKWPIPLTVDIKYGNSWRVKKKFFEDFPQTRARLSEPLMKIKEMKATSPIMETVLKETPKASPAEPISLDASLIVATEEIKKENDQKEPENKEIKETEVKPVEITPTAEKESSNFQVDENDLIYILRDTGEITVLHLNAIIKFILREQERGPDRYQSMKKILKIRDQKGNSLLVSEFKVPVDLFVGLARFFRI